MKPLRAINVIPIVALVLQATVAIAAPDTPAGGVATGAATPKADNDENARAHTLYRDALAAYKAQNYEESRKLLLQIWSFRQTYDVASALAKPEMKLKLYRDAATHLQYCLDNFAPVSSNQTLQSIKQMLTEAQTYVGTLRIKTNRDGAEIRVDGRIVGVSPLKSPVYVDPGQHEVTLAQGGDSANEPIEVTKGNTLDVEVPLEHASTPAVVQGPPTVSAVPPNSANPSVPPPAPFVPPEETHRSIVPVIIGGAVFAAGIGTGIGFRLMASSKQDEARTLRDKNGSSGCVVGSAPTSDCAAQRSAWQSKDRDQNISTAGLIVAGVALVAVPLYWFWPKSSNSNPGGALATLKIQSAVTSQESRVLISGEF